MPEKSKNHSAFANAIETGDAQFVAAYLAKHPELVDHPEWTPPPLHCAVRWNQPAIAKLLLDQGANIEMLDPDRQTTPLRYAIMYCKTDMIPLLLREGASTEPIIENGTSALQLAIDAANGAYAEFDDLPTPKSYMPIIALLREEGLVE